MLISNLAIFYQGGSALQVNSIKAKLKKGEAAIGTLLYIPSAKLAELVALCGYEFLVIDQEHGSIGVEAAEDMVRASELHNCVPIVRVSHLHSHTILQALDMGAMGVHVPNVNTAEDARRAVRLTRYASLGERGLAGVRAYRYGLREKMADYCRQANEEVMVIAHVESVEAVENLDAMLEVEGVDVYYLGPSDLSNSMGQPGVQDAKLQKVVADAIAKIVKAGKVAGTIATDVATARRHLDAGVRYIATQAMQMMTAGSAAFLKGVRE
jgi:2-keto-3-deoxy-L-rhamnonate aldolase RhmA